MPKVSTSVCSLSGTRDDRPAMENHLRANGDTDESGAQGRATELFSSKRIDTISVCAMRATIGGTSVGSYGDMSTTKLDSHANMAVAGQDCTIIAKSGHHANVTPFSEDLPLMEKVEIGDVATAYNDPYSPETYLLVMRNVLLIPSMDHNLLPPFLVWEASLFLDETPKFQSTDVSLENHTI